MAPRKQAKQPTAETVVATADGNVTPPKKRKIAAKSVAKPTTGSRSAKTEKLNKIADQSTFSPKKLRSNTKNTIEVQETTIAKNNTKSKTKRVNKQAVDNTDEKIEQQKVTEKQMVEKKPRGGTMKKAGTSRKFTRKSQENGEDDAEDSEDTNKNSTKNKAKLAARKRKNHEDAIDIVTEAESAQIVEKDEEMEMVANKKNRGKPKKVETETRDAPKIRPKGRATKNSAKVETIEPLSEELEVEEQSDQSVEIQENNSKIKNAKNMKKENAKKVTSKSKRNTAEEKTNDAPLEEAATIETPETDVEENGHVGHVETIETLESKQKKKKNMGKTSTVTNEKTETKGRQKKGQSVAVIKKETIQDEMIEKVNLSSEALNENGVKDVASTNQNDNSQENENK